MQGAGGDLDIFPEANYLERGRGAKGKSQVYQTGKVPGPVRGTMEWRTWACEVVKRGTQDFTQGTIPWQGRGHMRVLGLDRDRGNYYL